MVAVDADHDVGTLPLLVPAERRVTGGARHALSARRVTSELLCRDPSGLDILGGPFGPADHPHASAANLEALVGLLDHDVVVLDLGTGLSHPVIRLALERADHVLMVSGPELIGATRVEAALRRLIEHRRFDADHVTLVLNRVIAPELAAGQLERFRRTGVRHAVAVPDDEQLAELLDAGALAIDELRPPRRWRSASWRRPARRAYRSAFLNSYFAAASDSKSYLSFPRPNGLSGSTSKMVVLRGGLRSAAGPYS